MTTQGFQLSGIESAPEYYGAVSIDPRLGVGLSAPKGAIVVFAGSGAPEVLQKQDNGQTTNWSPIGGGTFSSLLQNTFFVAKNGNDATADGSVGKPYLTVQAAIDAAAIVSTPTTRCVVFVMPGTYAENCILKANVLVRGLGYNSSRITGTWVLDGSFTPAGDHRSGWADVGLFTPGTITADFLGLSSNEGKLYAWNVRFGGSFTATSFSSINQLLMFGCEIFGTLTLNGMNTQLIGCISQNSASVVCNRQAGGANSLTTSGGSLFSVTVNALVGAFSAYLGHAAQSGAGLTLNGTGATVYASTNSIPQRSLVSFIGGALEAQLQRLNDAFGLGFTPTTAGDWSPVPVSSQGALDQLGSRIEHVQRVTIDLAILATKKFALNAVPRNASFVKCSIVNGGTPQENGVDYTVAGGFFDFAGLGLDGVLVVGDRVELSYPI